MTWMSPSILLAAPVISSMMDSGARSTTRARKTLASSKICEREALAERVAGAGGDLDEAELADDSLGAADFVYVDGDFQFVEGGLDAVVAAFSGASQTMVMRETSCLSDSPTVNETMLTLRRRKREATRARTPGLSWTSAMKVWSMGPSMNINYCVVNKARRFVAKYNWRDASDVEL